MSWVTQRPPLQDRRFTSPAVEETIRSVTKGIHDPELAWLFENCFPNTLDTTVSLRTVEGKPYTYVITGDIDAMWLRDSTAQVWPYLPLMKQDPALRDLIVGVIHQQSAFVRLDPYANAFFADTSKVSEWQGDTTQMRPGVHERKWELDSLCYVIRLAYGYWRWSGDTSPFDDTWLTTMKLILATCRERQSPQGTEGYRFMRGWEAGTEDGWGVPARPNGLIRSTFRPSDDRTVFPYLIPANLFAAVSFQQLAELCYAAGLDPQFSEACRSLAREIRGAVERHGRCWRRGRLVYAYEVDGFGNHYFADDPNVPSLLSLPYLGVLSARDRIYLNTRNAVLNESSNPYFAIGSAAQGGSSPHCFRDMIWPLGIIVRALTATHDSEIANCVATLVGTHAGTGFMHESFHKDDPAEFTRPWFAWANSLFGELIYHLHRNRPHLL